MAVRARFRKHCSSWSSATGVLLHRSQLRHYRQRDALLPAPRMNVAAVALGVGVDVGARVIGLVPVTQDVGS